MTEPPVTVRDCLRNVMRCPGGRLPSADAIAAPLTDEELQELATGLLAILIERHRTPAVIGLCFWAAP